MLLCLVLYQPVFPAWAAAPTVVLRLANGEWPPYTGRDLPHQGCDSQVVAEAFALEGIRVEYQFFPWARGFLLSEHGVLDGAVEWAGTEEQGKSHYVSRDVLSRQQWVFFRRRDRPVAWQPLSSIPKVIIGLTIGYAYSDIFADLLRSRPELFTEASSDLLNFRKLLAGRIDLFPLERAVGRYLLDSRFSAEERAQLVDDPEPLAEFGPRLLLTRAIADNQEKMARFDRGLMQLKAGGRYREIMAPCTREREQEP